MNFSSKDLDLISDAIEWELELLPMHQQNPYPPRATRLRDIQARIESFLEKGSDEA